MNVRHANIVVIPGGMSFPPSTRSPAGRKSQVQDDSTAGGRLYGLRTRAKMTQEDLAEVLGVSRTQVSKYERDDGYMPDPVVMRAALRFSVTPSWIRYGDTDGRMVRVVGRVGAGGHVEAIAYDDGRQIEVPASWSDATALQVDGVSCWPTYEDGDIIIVRGEQRLVEAEFLNRMSVVETVDGLGLVKRVRRGAQPGLYTLESPNAPPIEDVLLTSARPVRMHLSD